MMKVEVANFAIMFLQQENGNTVGWRRKRDEQEK